MLVLSGCGGSSQDRAAAGPSFEQEFQSALKITSADGRARQLLDLAQRQYAADDRAGARRSLNAAGKACHEVTDPLSRAGVFTLLAETYAKLDNDYDAEKTIERAIDAAQQVDEDEGKAGLWCQIALVQGQQLSRRSAALDSVAKCEKIAQSLETAKGRVIVLASAGQTYAALADNEQSRRALGQAIATAAEMDDPLQRSDAQTIIAAAQVAAGDAQAAGNTLDQAQQSAESIEDAYRRIHAMVKIAKQLARASQPDRARELLQAAELLTRDVPEADLQNESLRLVRKTKADLSK